MGTHPIFESDFDCLTDELMDVYLEIPPVTRVYVSACLLVNAAVQLGYVTPYQLYFNYDLILKSGELWRLFTNFLYFGPMGLHFLFRYSRNLEEGSFRGRNADFIFFFLFGMVLLSISALFVNIIFLGNALNLMFVYLWARRNPFIRMTFFGVINFQAPYLPYVLAGFSLALGSPILVDVLGIICGHIYYYLEDVFPNVEGGFHILVTPYLLKRLFDPVREELTTENDQGEGPGGFDWGDENEQNRQN